MSTLVGLAAAGWALTAAAETAVRLTPAPWYSRAHGLVQVAGVDRTTCLLGCLGLCLSLLCVACAAAGPALVRRRRTVPFLETAGLGLSVVLGGGVSGSLLGWTCSRLVSWGLRGFVLAGFVFSLILLLTSKQQLAETPCRMLVLHTVSLLTMYLGVWSGQVLDLSRPRVCVVNVLLAPAAFLLGLQVRRTCSSSTIFVFVLLVPLSGLVFGLGTERHHGAEPLLHHTYSTVQFLVSTLEILTGVLGSLGGLCVSLGAPGPAGSLAVWISVPAAATLWALDEDSPHPNLLSVLQPWVGAAGVLGLTSGLAAASGLALGLALRSAAEALWLVGGPVLRAAGVDVVSFHLRPAAEGVLRNNRCVWVDAGVNFALLAVAMMGSAVVGVAGFLTASLGSAGLAGTVLAGTIAGLAALSPLSK